MSSQDSSGSYGQYGEELPQVHHRVEPWRTVIPMHPLSVGETLDSAIRLIRFNPVPFIIFPIIVNLGVAAVETLVTVLMGQSLTFDVAGLRTSTLYLLISLAITLVANLLVLVAGTRVTLASVRGEKLSLSDTFAFARKDLGKVSLRIIGLTLITFVFVGVFVFAIITAFIALFSAMLKSDSLALTSLIVPAFSLFTLIFLVFYRFTVVAPAIVTEDLGPLAGLARSWKLTKGSLGYFVGMFAALLAISSVLSTIVTVFFAFTFGVFNVSSAAGSVSLAMGAGSILLSLLLSALLVPISTAIINLIYVNMRMKRENFHQEFLYGAGSSHTQPGALIGSPRSDADARQAGPVLGQGGYGQYEQPGDRRPNQWDGRPQWYGDHDKA
ncbi:hypothetical protein [Trueperella pyogenes]